MTGKKLISAVFLLGTFALLAVVPTHQAVALMRPDLDVPWLTTNSVDIVTGEIVGMHVERRFDIEKVDELIVTVVTVRTATALKGSLAPEALTEFTILGGELKGETNKVSNMPEDLRVGDKGVFFIRDNWRGLRVPAGWLYGCARYVSPDGSKIRVINQEMDSSALIKQVKALVSADH